jgi:hypothetical protein
MDAPHTISMDNPYMDPCDAPWTNEYWEGRKPKWLEDDESDEWLFEDALFGVI